MRETKFKYTDIGHVPYDWAIKTVWEVAPLKRGMDLPKQNLAKGPYPVVYSNGIGAYHREYQCQAPGLITGRSGTLGKFTLIKDGFYWPHNTTLWVTDFNDNDPMFLYYLYSTLNFEESSTGTGVPTLNRNFLKDIKVVVPPLAEQKAIGQALSDIDGLIDSLKKLIDKKRNIKQGSMSCLLTGKRRLPGFIKDWSDYTIGSLTSVQAGATPSTENAEYWNGVIRWMNSGEINLKYVREVENRITQKGYNSTSTHMLPKHCILLGLAGQGKTRGTAAINMIELCTNQSIAAIYPSESFNSFFLYHLLDSKYNDLRMLSSGEGARGGLTKRQIENYSVFMPSDIEEQEAIAKILTDMDDEIESLEKKLSKYEQVKQGMMAQLLTGKIRLI